ncbi:Serine/threonine-protein kinase Nek4 [Plecturocebus cupreus]
MTIFLPGEYIESGTQCATVSPCTFWHINVTYLFPVSTSNHSRDYGSLLPKLECSGMIIACCSLKLLGSSDSLLSASRIVRTMGTCHHIDGGLTMLPRLVSNSCLGFPNGLVLYSPVRDSLNLETEALSDKTDSFGSLGESRQAQRSSKIRMPPQRGSHRTISVVVKLESRIYR